MDKDRRQLLSASLALVCVSALPAGILKLRPSGRQATPIGRDCVLLDGWVLRRDDLRPISGPGRQC